MTIKVVVANACMVFMMTMSICHRLFTLVASPYFAPVLGVTGSLGTLVVAIYEYRKEKTWLARIGIALSIIWLAQSGRDLWQIKSDETQRQAEERKLEELDPRNQRVGNISATGSLTVEGFNLYSLSMVARPLILDFHQRGTPQRSPLLCFTLDRLPFVVSNECSMTFLPMSVSCPLPSNTVGNLLASIDTCRLTFNGASVSSPFRATGGVITLTANDVPKRFLLPPQRVPSTGFVALIGTEEGTNVSHVVWGQEQNGSGLWEFRLE
ncbi:MAG TPA: hypothetical protein VMP11_14160 [Verrucomicrobiae bacterium]|nr:hypothetical protein [Verrucomicrobiae bacterium]